MLIWLPPSEGKACPPSGPRLDLTALLFPELAEARTRVIGALRALGDGAEAASVLKLGPKSAPEASFNRVLADGPCTPAISLYTGVLYDNLRAETLTAAGRDSLERHAWILSALFGFVRPSDPLPNHRLSMGVSLPGLGALAPWWRARLGDALPPLAGRAILDCRPGAYRAAYPAPEADVLELRVAQVRDGERRVVTHMSKKWRGIAVRHLVEDRRLPERAGADEVLTSLETLRATDESIAAVEADRPSRTREGGTLTRVTLVTRAA